MEIDALIAKRLLALRAAKGLTLERLAEKSGVSKAMISRIERAQSSPTATILGRLAAGLSIRLASLLADEEGPVPPLRKRSMQELWRDPELGFHRTQVSLRDPITGIELVEIQLPRHTQVSYPRWSGEPYRQRLWMTQGQLQVSYGEERFDLNEGDFLDFGVDRSVSYKTLGRSACKYLLVISAK